MEKRLCVLSAVNFISRLPPFLPNAAGRGEAVLSWPDRQLLPPGQARGGRRPAQPDSQLAANRACPEAKEGATSGSRRPVAVVAERQLLSHFSLFSLSLMEPQEKSTDVNFCRR